MARAVARLFEPGGRFVFSNAMLATKSRQARAAKMAPEERSAIAKKAAEARWAKMRQREESS